MKQREMGNEFAKIKPFGFLVSYINANHMLTLNLPSVHKTAVAKRPSALGHHVCNL